MPDDLPLQEPHAHYDPDLVAVLERHGDQGLAEARAHQCLCGHPRSDHPGATGALASFGGSACDGCWTCGTFRPVDQAAWDHLTGPRDETGAMLGLPPVA